MTHHVALGAPRFRPSRSGLPLRLALAFWAFTYAVLAVRAVLRYEDVALLLTAQRLAATGFGAGLYWLMLTRLDGIADVRRAAMRALSWVVPAALAIFAFRYALAREWPGPGDAFVDTTAGTLLWSGYFAAWALGGVVLTAPRAIVPVARIAPCRAAVSVDAWAWVVDRLAQEMVAAPAATRAEIVARLAQGGGYAIADPLDPRYEVAAARADIVARLLA